MKKIFIILITLCTFNAFAQIPTNGLVAHYPFNGNANDISGNANNGIVNGATLTTDRFGNANSAYSFDGTSNYIRFSDSNLPKSNSNRSFSMWVKYQSNNDWSSLLSYGKAATKGGHNELLISQGGILNFDYFNLNSTTINSVANQIWYHIVYEFDNTSGTQIYINGILQSLNVGGIALNTNNLSNINTTLDGNMFIGKAPQMSLYPYYFKGTIDDTRIYNRVLSLNEVTALYNEDQCVNNITVTDTLKIGRITGVNAIPDNFGLVKVYPNPTKDVLNISATNPSASYTIQITNNIGTVLYSNSLLNNNLQVNLNTLGANGLYFIKILDVSNNLLDTRKLVLE